MRDFKPEFLRLSTPEFTTVLYESVVGQSAAQVGATEKSTSSSDAEEELPAEQMPQTP